MARVRLGERVKFGASFTRLGKWFPAYGSGVSCVDMIVQNDWTDVPPMELAAVTLALCAMREDVEQTSLVELRLVILTCRLMRRIGRFYYR